MSSSEQEIRETMGAQVRHFTTGPSGSGRARFNEQLSAQAALRVAESAIDKEDPDGARRTLERLIREAHRSFEQSTSERMAARIEADRTEAALAAERKRLEADAREVSILRGMLAVERTRNAELSAALAQRSTRRASRAAAPPAVPDPDSASLRPDPSAAETPADFMAQLRLYKTWSGNPGFRQIAAGTGQRYTASALQAAITRDVLPRKHEMVDAIVQGCGGSNEDRQTWATAWRRLTMQPASRMPLALVLEFSEGADDRSA